MSFFSDDTFCLECSRKEEEIRTKIRAKWGANADLQYEGCGFVPDLKKEGPVASPRQSDLLARRNLANSDQRKLSREDSEKNR